MYDDYQFLAISLAIASPFAWLYLLVLAIKSISFDRPKNSSSRHRRGG